MIKSYNKDTVNASGVTLKRLTVGPLSKSPIVDGKLKIKYLPLQLTRVSGHFATSGGYSSWNEVGSLPVEIRQTGFGISETLEQDALFKAYCKASEKVANVADFIRTRMETANMAASLVRDLVRSARAIRKGRIADASRILGVPLHRNPKGKEFSERWLEYSYGWSPTLNDIYNLLNKGFGDVTLEVKTKEKDFVTNEKDIDTSGSTGYASSSSRTSIKVCMKLEVPNTAFGAISAWGLDNPAAVAWEAMPFSFCVDWLLPVGDYVNASLNIWGNPIVKEMCISRVTTHSMEGDLVFRYDYNKRKLHFWQRSIIVDRTNTIYGMPLPRIQNPFTSATRLMNQLALAKVVFKT